MSAHGGAAVRSFRRPEEAAGERRTKPSLKALSVTGQACSEP
jgi:hypothetical protein